MEGKKSCQRQLSYAIPPFKEIGYIGAGDGECVRYLCSDGCCPERDLIPWQQITCESERQDKQEETNPDNPIHVPWVFIGAVKVDPQHMDQYRNHHDIGGPVMKSPDQPSKGDIIGDMHDAVIGLVNRGSVIHQEEYPGNYIDDK